MRPSRNRYSFKIIRYVALPILFLSVVSLMSVRGPESSHGIQLVHRAPVGIVMGVTGKSVADLELKSSPAERKNLTQDHGDRSSVQSPEFKQKVAAKVLQRQSKGPKPQKADHKASGGADQRVALLLAILLGAFGIHRFYLGYYGIGVVQLLTGGGCGIWLFIDQIRIVTGQLQPKGGYYEKTL